MPEPQSSAKMSQETAMDPAVYGKPLLEWEFHEYDKHQRGPFWFLAALLIVGGLLTYAFMERNFLFAIIILLTLFILFMNHRREPLQIPCVLTTRGVRVGANFYQYADIKAFAVVYEPPLVKRLYLEPKDAILNREVSIPLMDQNPLKVRSVLLDYVYEDLERESESMYESVSRLIKF